MQNRLAKRDESPLTSATKQLITQGGVKFSVDSRCTVHTAPSHLGIKTHEYSMQSSETFTMPFRKDA